MAFYLVNYRGKQYANRALAKAIHETGDSGLTKLIVRGAVKAVELLDLTVYEIKMLPKHHHCEIVIQDLDNQLLDLKGVRKAASSKEMIYKLGGFSFFPLTSLSGTNKYREVSKEPHIKVFNKKYIAVSVQP